MRRLPIVAVFLARALAAQQTVAPTPEQVGSPRGEGLDGFNVLNSFETGYRFRLVSGNEGRYRSDVNYPNGVRLLGSSLRVNSREGHGRFFDEIVLNTQGLGNDPYEFANLRVQKNRVYRYDMLWRMNEYFNPGLTIANGQHWFDTSRRLQDHDLTLAPQSNWNLRLGYSRENQTGPALSTVQLFDGRGDQMPIFRDVRRTRNEYRVGGEMLLVGFRVNFLHAWDNFKEDTPYSLDGFAPVTVGQTTLTQFRRDEPYHGNTPLWRVNVHREEKLWAMNGRFTYAGGRRNFVLDELAVGSDRFGAAQNRQIVVTGSARRPVATGDLLVSITPGEKLSFVNNTSFYNNRIDGDSSYLEYDNATSAFTALSFQFLGMRTVSNSSELTWRASKLMWFRGGYQYSSRRVESVLGPPPTSVRYAQENRLHSGIAGVRLQPLKPLSINLDAEIGRADHPFFPIGERNYHRLGARVRYKNRTWQLETAYRQVYNTNSVALAAFASRSRDYTASASWNPRGRFSLDANYARMHLDTASGIAYFVRFALQQGRSIYISNIHSGNLGGHLSLGRADLYVGYSIVQDTGDPRAPSVFDATAILAGAPQAYPLRYQTPLARLSVRLHEKLRWNAGWQFYSYGEDTMLFGIYQNYRAHTGYTSVLWSF